MTQVAVPRGELECAICMELLCEPQQLPCSHVFCRRCLWDALRADRRCPLCRDTIPEGFDPCVAPVHAPLEQVLLRSCTLEYEQRLQDVLRAAAQLVQLRIGNTYQLLGMRGARLTHEWTVQVHLQPHPESPLPIGAKLPDLIDHVSFGLAPACRLVKCSSGPAENQQADGPAPSLVEVSEAPFQLTARSWCSFTVPIIVTWKDWVAQPPLRLDHALDFHRDGGNWEYGVDLRDALSVAKNEQDIELTTGQEMVSEDISDLDALQSSSIRRGLWLGLKRFLLS